MHPHYDNEKMLLAIGYQKEEIFDFPRDKDVELYDRFFQFTHVNLTTQWKHYNIQPGIFFYYESDEINAYAEPNNGHFIIALNKGLIAGLFDFFEKNKQDLKEICERKFPAFVDKLDVPIGFLFFQLTTMFTYYHEHGHILQFSDGVGKKLWERKALKGEEDFDLNDHAMEIDADVHAAHLMTFHIIEYWQKLPQQDRTKGSLENLLSITAAGIFVFFFFLNEGITKLYFKESTHPHEVIRISYIVEAILGVAQENKPELGDLDSKRTLQNSFYIADELLKVGAATSIEEFITPFWNERGEIGTYLQEMLDYMKSLPFLVRNHDKPYR